ncbi:MAG: T9SS type A sorting domain-containing protein [Bacteroidales bacterium]|nr:T9SS type A sorting domain-containing protein [Bacteroidales bacterium]
MNWKNYFYEIDISFANQGIYLVKIHTENKSFTRKIIKL